MISARHPNARELFTRDVECLLRFFQRKMHYDPEDDDELEPELLEAAEAGAGRAGGFDAGRGRELIGAAFECGYLERWPCGRRGVSSS